MRPLHLRKNIWTESQRLKRIGWVVGNPKITFLIEFRFLLPSPAPPSPSIALPVPLRLLAPAGGNSETLKCFT